jgi:uncharacterized phiE125 gp8 family phage protein
MRFELITPPAELAVTLEEAKLAATEEGTAHDEHFTNIWIPAATLQAENRMGGRAIVTQSWRLTLDAFPRMINITKSPLLSVQSIKYIDVDGVLQTMDPADYSIQKGQLDGLVYPAYNKCWPSTRNEPGAVRIEFTAGFGTAENVPASIKNWILMAVATWYRQREGIVTGTIVSELPRNFCEALLDQYTIHRI